MGNICGEAPALSVTTNDPVAWPTEVEAKLTVIVQELPGGTLPAQVSASLNVPLADPVGFTAMLEIESTAEPEFES